MNKEKKYLYCSVVLEDYSRSFYYVYDGESIEDNSMVLVPFGYENRIVLGKVETSRLYNEANVPFPLARTKQILKVLTTGENTIPLNILSEIAEYEEYVHDVDLENLLAWACKHHDETQSDLIESHVIKAYEFCVEKKYDLKVSALNLGAKYYCGIAIEQDYNKAAEYYKIAADAGSIRAACNLGYCFYYGRHVESPDYFKAYEYFVKGAMLGDANSLYKVGDMYLKGQYVAKSEEFAFKLYSRALDELEFDESIEGDIMLRIAKCYMRGIGVEVDCERAFSLLCEAYAKLYERRKTDPFIKSVIKQCRGLMYECEKKLENDMVNSNP